MSRLRRIEVVDQDGELITTVMVAVKDGDPTGEEILHAIVDAEREGMIPPPAVFLDGKELT